MANHPEQEQPQPIQINTGDDILRGRYSNTVIVSHGSDEFILDWILNSPSGAHLVSRVIVSPSHIKKIIDVLTVNISQYEKKFGPIKVIDPSDQKFH